MNAAVIEGAAMVFSIKTLLIMCGGVFLGVTFGAIPGLTSSIGIAIMLPITFYLDPIPALSLLCAIYVGGAYGGSIAAILFGTPGTPESSTTTFDGYPMTKKGLAKKALSTALYSSAAGNFLSSLLMIVMAVFIAKFALLVGPAEYFAIILFSLVLIATVGSKGSVAKGLASVMIGLFVSFIGADPITATPRFNFGSINLTSNIQLIPVLVGLFVGAEVLKHVSVPFVVQKMSKVENKEQNRITGKDIKRCIPCILTGSVLGSVLGALPALNATVAATLNYTVGKKISKTPEEFGTGCIEGVASAESANNATVGPALVPLLTLGIPGTGTAAIFLGALMMQGVIPGPMIFEEHGSLVYGIFFCLIFSTILLVFIGKAVIHIAQYVLSVPRYIIYPIILLLCCAGAFCSNRRIFDIYILLAFMLLGYLMNNIRIPVLPLIIGFLLGNTMERTFRQTMLISKGSLVIFAKSPIALIFLIVTAIMMVYFVISEIKDKKAQKGSEAEESL
ncbi:tripartite tricarboxylate transporter permease [Clostridium sp. AM58-1XD]|uniref:tripartite tricarboxylate transporter permease n=1 Tax=Clostridium sp. AM58-1XD TaxID=2292307 RepID=UPI000E50F4EE|nr:tripartite tricarboxylate transporter permease [Clostridium sp. AM58-1XD]RGZ01204.1 hypothetical protein DXA13_02345 [Clostridium sp. AM58-1XD]